MNPALSIVFFTVFSGGGLGLAAALAVFADLLPRDEFAATAILAATLTGCGLFASVFHLANPKNAWRAFLRVRTSWLSREAVCAVLFFVLLLSWTAARFWGEEIPMLRAAVLAAALSAVFCTAMIYQSLKPIAAWHHPLTAFCYLAFALQSGAMLFSVCASFGGNHNPKISAVVLICTVVAVATKLAYYRRLGKTEDVRVGRAAGFSRAHAKLLESGHAAQTFLTREFIFFVSAKELRVLRIVALSIIAIAPPVAAMFASRGDSHFAIFAAAVLFFGLCIERWLFFAEAKHAVRAYHGIGAP